MDGGEQLLDAGGAAGRKPSRAKAAIPVSNSTAALAEMAVKRAAGPQGAGGNLTVKESRSTGAQVTNG